MQDSSVVQDVRCGKVSFVVVHHLGKDLLEDRIKVHSMDDGRSSIKVKVYISNNGQGQRL